MIISLFLLRAFAFGFFVQGSDVFSTQTNVESRGKILELREFIRVCRTTKNENRLGNKSHTVGDRFIDLILIYIKLSKCYKYLNV